MKDVLVFGQDAGSCFLDLPLTTTMDPFRLQILSHLHHGFFSNVPNLAMLGDTG